MANNGNINLHMSRAEKQDEFYTQISMIEDELKYYRKHFAGKVVFCNCDDPAESNFWKYFQLNFYHLGLKKMISTHYEEDKPSYKLEIVAVENQNGQIGIPDYVTTPLKQNGDFRSDECVEIMKEADIIVTNPPFSLFRDYMDLLMKYEKDFLIIGRGTAATYKEILPLFLNGKLWLGRNSGHFWFRVPDYYEEKKTDFKIDENGIKWRRMGNICWFTNLDYKERHENINLFRNYDSVNYPKYDNYDAIDVNEVKNIPCDYYGVMGVPTTFLTKWNPEQFEILGSSRYHDGSMEANDINFINGKGKFTRILIRRKSSDEDRNE